MPLPGGSGMLRLVAACGALADDVDAAAARRIVLVLMQRDREHVRIGEEDRLGAVAVVDVPVDDRDAPDAAHLPVRAGSRCRCSRRRRSPSTAPARRGGRAGARARRRCRPCRRARRRPRRSSRPRRVPRSRRRSGPSPCRRRHRRRSSRPHARARGARECARAGSPRRVAGRARSCTRWSSTPETSSRLRKRRFVSGFSKRLLRLHVRLRRRRCEVVPGHCVVPRVALFPEPSRCHADDSTDARTATFRIPAKRSVRSMSLPALLGGVPVADADTYPSLAAVGRARARGAARDARLGRLVDGGRRARVPLRARVRALPGRRGRLSVHERHADARGGARRLRRRRGRRGDRAGHDVRRQRERRAERSTRRP